MSYRTQEEIEALIDADSFKGLGAYYKAMSEQDYTLARQICARVRIRLSRAGKSSRTDEYKEWGTRYYTALDMGNLDIWIKP